MLFLLCSLLRLRFVSVVFNFNASLNDVAPVSPMSLSVNFVKKKRKEWIVDRCYLCDVSFMLTLQIKLNECCV